MPPEIWAVVNAGICDDVNAPNWSELNAAMSAVPRVRIWAVVRLAICEVVKVVAKLMLILLEVLLCSAQKTTRAVRHRGSQSPVVDVCNLFINKLFMMPLQN
jgi:hypothetical protein